MNKFIDDKVFLVLRETKEGHDLYINKVKQKIVIENGIIQNDLKEYQLDFVKSYI